MTDERKILFMGSPDFAVESLKTLVENGYRVVGVFSQPDKPKGRGHETLPTPVKAYALSAGIPVYTPQTLRDGSAEPILKELDPDLIVVVAYGKILPAYVLEYPKYGCLNIHGSLLPMYRGASPINFALIRGEKETGVTSMLMDEGVDTGDMLLKRACPIEENDDFGTLHDKLAALGASLLLETVAGLFAGTLTPQKQEGETFYAPLIDNTVRKLDFSLTTEELLHKIRGLSPVPTAFTTLGGKMLKVYAAADGGNGDLASFPAGTLLSAKELRLRTADGSILLTDVAPEGKRRMEGKAFMAGLRLSDPTSLKAE